MPKREKVYKYFIQDFRLCFNVHGRKKNRKNVHNLYQFVRHVHIFLKRKPVSKQPALTIKQIVRKCRLKPVTLSISQDVFQSAISQPANIGPGDAGGGRPGDQYLPAGK